jgi:excinuclease UvrABC nuclease subunit
MNLTTAYPRAYVTRRVSSSGLYFGPFASRRAAEGFLEPLLDLFRIRRCQIKIRRDPAFPGCIYSEMKMCLAPCFAGCTEQEYASEASHVAEFLSSRGASLSQELARERETASSGLDFERAAAQHRRLEKVDAVRRGMPELARRLDLLDAVVLERAAGEKTIAVFRVRAGRISEPFLLRFDELASHSRSAEEILRGVLQPAGDIACDSAGAAEIEDHLGLLARWFYGRPREGEIFFPETRPDGWPYRRILRACARLLAPRDAQAPS